LLIRWSPSRCTCYIYPPYGLINLFWLLRSVPMFCHGLRQAVLLDSWAAHFGSVSFRAGTSHLSALLYLSEAMWILFSSVPPRHSSSNHRSTTLLHDIHASTSKNASTPDYIQAHLSGRVSFRIDCLAYWSIKPKGWSENDNERWSVLSASSVHPPFHPVGVYISLRSHLWAHISVAAQTSTLPPLPVSFLHSYDQYVIFSQISPTHLPWFCGTPPASADIFHSNYPHMIRYFRLITSVYC
jgi:hypothetical protein